MEQRIRSALASRALVVFTAGDETLAAPAEEVAGMLDAERIVPIPGRPSPMAGVLAFRGSVVPTLDLAAALGAGGAQGAPYAVVLERGTDRFALLVRGMPRLVTSKEFVERESYAPELHAEPPATLAPETNLEAAAAGRGAGADGAPKVLALYEVQGRPVRRLDYWSLMDSIAPPAAFRLSGLGGR